MRAFYFSESREPGTYKPCLHEGRRTAFVVCPECGTRLLLNPHIVTSTGEVLPSVVCREPCKFHEFVLLLDWRYGR